VSRAVMRKRGIIFLYIFSLCRDTAPLCPYGGKNQNIII
jgi:hypothetical protein